MLHSLDYTVAPCVEFRILNLQFRMFIDIGQGFAHALLEAGRRTEARHCTLELAAVVHYCHRLIPQQRASEVICTGSYCGKIVRRHIIWLELHTESIRYGLEYRR